MFSLNRIQIIGYQTQPVQIRQTPGGTSVTDLNLVVPYSFKSESGDMLEGKSFHVVTLWGPMADVAGRFVKPGAQLFVSGRLQTDSWEDEKTSEKRSKTKVVALDMILLDPKDGQMSASSDAKNLLTCVNRADIVGNVTRDPEIRSTTSGHKVLTLGVATNERWKDRATNQDKERTEFHNVVLWGSLAETVGKHVKKGNRVFVSGRVQTRSWETKEGSKRTTTEIIGESFSLLGVKNPAVEGTISMEGAPMRREAPQRSAPRASSSDDMGDSDATLVSYSSDVKAEDLPF
jgi:single-strand DNA-binding protein